jgi:ribosomal protein S18 acetylase RimI-like enzyme
MDATAQAPPGDLTIRSQWREGDADAIVELHRRVYIPEYGVDESFVTDIAVTLTELEDRGAWPGPGEGAWLVDSEDGLAASLLLSDQGDGEGRVRHFVIAPEQRGSGLGRKMFEALMERVREFGYERVTLSTFADLKAAAHMYRGAGFRIVREEPAPRWGRETFVYQHYALDLQP